MNTETCRVGRWLPWLIGVVLPVAVCTFAQAQAVSFQTLTGRVTYAREPAPNGVAGVTVNLSGGPSPLFIGATTNDDGFFSFTVKPGRYSVSVKQREGIAVLPGSIAVDVAQANVTGVDFVAERLYSISGSVRDASAASAAATLVLSGPGADTPPITTDPERGGTFSFSGLPEGDYQVRATSDGNTVVEPRSRSVSVRRGNVVDVDFVVRPRTYFIDGSLGPQGVGATVSLNRVQTSRDTVSANDRRINPVWADDRGYYRFSGVESGSYEIRASKTGFSVSPDVRRVFVRTANVSGVNFVVRSQPASVSGSVGREGAGARMNITFVRATTSQAGSGPLPVLIPRIEPVTADTNGAYVIPDLNRGIYMITPTNSGQAFDPPNREVAVSGTDVTGVDFRVVPQPRSVSGSVGREGAGARMIISFVRATTSQAGTGPTPLPRLIAPVTADQNGAYIFPNLGRGIYKITPTNSGQAFDPPNNEVEVLEADVTGVDFTVVPQTHSISGSVGREGARATMNISLVRATTSQAGTGPATRPGPRAPVTAGPNGAYFFQDLGRGIYEITPTNSDQVFNPKNVQVEVLEADVTGVDFTVVPQTHSISGSVGREGARATMNISLVRATTSQAGTGPATRPGPRAPVTAGLNGAYFFQDLGRGIYEITPTNSDQVFNPKNVQVEVLEADVTGIDFTVVPQKHSISGSVGAAGAGVKVQLSFPFGIVKTVDSDARGIYLFTDLIDSSYTVRPAKRCYEFSPASRGVTLRGADAENIDFVAAPATYSISGSVGTTGAGARLWLTGAGRKMVEASGSGEYSFTGLRGDISYTVTPSKAGFLFSPRYLEVRLECENVRDKNFTASPATYSIGGRVIAGAIVTLASAKGWSKTAISTGNYRFSDLLSGDYTVQASMSGYSVSPTSISVSLREANVENRDFDATPLTYSISGTVTANGSPKPGVTVTLSGRRLRNPRPTTTDRWGRFVFDGLSVGVYTVVVPRQGKMVFVPASRTVTIKEESISNINFSN